MTESIIERVAQAVYNRANAQTQSGTLPPWAGASAYNRNNAIGATRAAIEAMREPTDAMLMACHMKQENISRNQWSLTGRKAHLARWRAMIDKAMEE